jgi:hypothetical protein
MPSRWQLLATLLCAVLVACSPASAGAAETAAMKATFSPYRLGAPTTIEIEVTIVGSNGGVPGPVTSFNTRLPPRLELVGSTLGLAVCQPAALAADGLSGCSPNAQVGLGTALVEVPFGPAVVSEVANVVALMGPPLGENVEVLLFAEGLTPVFAQSVFPGVLLLSGIGQSESLNTTVPLTPSLPGAPDVSVSHIKLSVGPKHLIYYRQLRGRSVAFHPTGVSLPPRCPTGGFAFRTELTFQDGTDLKLTSVVPCPAASQRRTSSRHTSSRHH